MKFESVTTKGGDKGFTSLFNGDRIAKTSQTIKTMGEIDSLNAFLGIIRANQNIRKYDKNVISQIQQNLYEIMGILSGFNSPFPIERLEFLEKKQKLYMRFLKIPNVFINFGDNEEAALFNLARTQARKAEIAFLELKLEYGYVKNYFNRLSDLLYVMSIIYEYAGKKKSKKLFDFLKRKA